MVLVPRDKSDVRVLVMDNGDWSLFKEGEPVSLNGLTTDEISNDFVEAKDSAIASKFLRLARKSASV